MIGETLGSRVRLSPLPCYTVGPAYRGVISSGGRSCASNYREIVLIPAKIPCRGDKRAPTRLHRDYAAVPPAAKISSLHGTGIFEKKSFILLKGERERSLSVGVRKSFVLLIFTN